MRFLPSRQLFRLGGGNPENVLMGPISPRHSTLSNWSCPVTLSKACKRTVSYTLMEVNKKAAKSKWSPTSEMISIKWCESNSHHKIENCGSTSYYLHDHRSSLQVVHSKVTFLPLY